jgi:hypothetical protein
MAYGLRIMGKMDAGTQVDLMKDFAKTCFCISGFALASYAAGADGKLLGTGGLMSIEGSAGGGITPWAVLAGYGENDQWSISAAVSQTQTQDFRLRSESAALGLFNRVELSFARQHFDTPNGLSAQGNVLGQDVFGAKVRVAGDLIYGSVPQLSVGAQFKRSTQANTLAALGISDSRDVDLYASVSRLFLSGPFDRSVLLNATARSTKAQQTGLLGFSKKRRLVFEGSAALLLNRSLALGLEYRIKPDQLPGLAEDAWKDVFLSWFPNKNLTLAIAYVDLGSIAGNKNQSGYFFTLQGQF